MLRSRSLQRLLRCPRPQRRLLSTEEPHLGEHAGLVKELVAMQTSSAWETVPWFMRAMPQSYFRQVDGDLQKLHLRTIASLRELGQHEMTLKLESKVDDAGSIDVTYFNTGASQLGLLHSQIMNTKVPAKTGLSKVKVFSTTDNAMALNIFSFESLSSKNECADKTDCQRLFRYLAALQESRVDGLDKRAPVYDPLRHSEAAVLSYVARCSPSYVRLSDPRRFLVQMRLFDEVCESESAAVHMETAYDVTNESWITIAASNVMSEVLLRLATSVLAGHGLSIQRAHLDTVKNSEHSTEDYPAYVTMLRLLVHVNPAKTDVAVLTQDLRRCKWIDSAVVNLGLFACPSLGVDKAEVVCALATMLHGPLTKVDSHSYASVKSILQMLSSKDSVMSIADGIASLFLSKFNPVSPLSSDATAELESLLQKRINAVQNETVRELLQRMLGAYRAVLRTNFYNADRYALSMRLQPSVMLPDASKPVPFGTFFIYGRHFAGFHNRFRDIARGGLRVVTPSNDDLHTTESSRLYDEVYGLSYAQQLKNKDIPEGGSKGVILVNTPNVPANRRLYAIRKSIRAFTDSLLDLVVEPSIKGLVDLYHKEEIIYLGPDEQIIPSDIDWITARAAQRGYPIPAAFMSSKQGAGFNHKQFGVTSEGVAVFMEVALKSILGIDPSKQPFTMKITGGPDGDVAGNLIKILLRDYGKNVIIVGIADGSGCVEDPNGLDHKELLRLVSVSSPVIRFHKHLLSSEGQLFDGLTEEGALRRNSMHCRLKADVFVPAGGRPNTINSDNWRAFLDENGDPSSKLIVEGANLFLNADARTRLFKEAHVAIVKDSSANKCGVITSSCEVAASMLLSEREFLELKEPLVADVLKKLRDLARLEAELLFREFKNFPGALPQFSERISMAISAVADALGEALSSARPGDTLFEELFPLVLANLPDKLREVAGDRVKARFPVQYQRNAMASTLASHFVYSEGIHAVEIQPREKLAARVIRYYREETKVLQLIAELEANPSLAPATRTEMVYLLRKGGARSLLDTF